MITSSELKLYAKASSSVGVYTSSDGKLWIREPLASTPPAPALDGRGWYLNVLLPGSSVAFGTLLKIELRTKRVELAQVRIQHA